MMNISQKFSILAFCLLLTACNGGSDAVEEKTAEIGASLNEKTDVSIKNVPAAVLAAAQERRPDLKFSEAEREIRNGVVYYDIGGSNADGEEVELDIMQDGDGWTVAEVQRDIAMDETPEPVRDALLQNAPGSSPDRIIESDQGDGIIIYEFFLRATDGVETKHEVKFDGETATFLTEEWVH